MLILYRIGNWLFNAKIPVLPKIVDFLIRLVHNSAVYSETKIGKGTEFGYGGIAVVIHKRAIIGSNCLIGSSVSIGGKSKSRDVPVIGNDVYLATGSKILGPIKIGNNCVIGANSVVISSIPDNCMAVGIPAKIIKTNIISNDYR